ncbi:hypothetical protein EYF80_015154 [Liparis tanakae]|uniref:Uncharacterized protein n=1 Tax=Liparis tanakae TaxID=230148 RepID=A0A4Z2I9J1_9TELE|nr:hypothetical protein EYF80_015154 [Liparis tanakae]
MKETLAKEQELEVERAVKAKLLEEKAKDERLQREMQNTDNEILERAKKEKKAEEAQERLAQLGRAIEDRQAAQGPGGEAAGALKKAGRDLKEKAAEAQADPGEGAEAEAVKAEPGAPQGNLEKIGDRGEPDLRRRRRALGPREAGGPPEEAGASRGMPGLEPLLEPLLELGGSDLHVALEERLLAGAMVHSRQIKQASEVEGAK